MPSPQPDVSLSRHGIFLNEAISIALDNVLSNLGGPFGAVIVQEDQVIARAVNQVTTGQDPTAHAEVQAIRSACSALGNFQLRGCTLYSSCEPCPMCLGAIYWARLDAVFFAATRYDAARAGFDDALIYQQLTVPTAQRVIPFLQIDLPLNGEPFLAWIERQDKAPY